MAEAPKPEDVLEDNVELDEIESDSQRQPAGTGGPSWRDTYNAARRMAARRQTSLAASSKVGAKLASRAIPGVGWALLAWDLLKNPLARRLALLGIGIVLVIIIALSIAIFSLIGLVAEKFFGTGFSNPVQVTNQEDMDMVRYLKCLDEPLSSENALSEECKTAVTTGVAKGKEWVARLRKTYETAKDTPEKTAAFAAMDAYEAELAALEENISDVKSLRERKTKILEAEKTLEAALNALGVQISVSLDVPGKNQPDAGWCGYTSVAMVAQYFADKLGSDKTITPEICQRERGQHVNQLNSQLNTIFTEANQAPIQYTDHKLDPNTSPEFFPLILRSLAKGAPVILYTGLYRSQNGQGHVIVLTGYDPVQKLFTANNPNITGEKDVTVIDGVTLTQEGIKQYSTYYQGKGFLSYDGDRNFR